MVFLSVVAIFSSIVFYIKYWLLVAQINTKINSVTDSSLGDFIKFKYLNSYILLSHPAFTKAMLTGQFNNVLDQDLINLLSRARKDYIKSLISFFLFVVLCVYQIHFRN